jgi:hypothetical protein
MIGEKPPILSNPIKPVISYAAALAKDIFLIFQGSIS